MKPQQFKHAFKSNWSIELYNPITSIILYFCFFLVSYIYLRKFYLREDKKLLGWVYDSRVTEHISLNTSIEVYDLAGHSEYQSSHAAMLESLCLDAPAIFILIVDLTKSNDQVRKEIYKWAHFLEIQSSGISCRVIVLGSRRDQFWTNSDFLSKCKFVEQSAVDALGNQLFAGFVAVDARQLSSSNIHPFLQLLARNINDLIIPQVHEKMSFGCHFLYSFVKKNVKENAISFQHLQNLVSKEAFLCRLSDRLKLSSTLEAIAMGCFCFFVTASIFLPVVL